MNERIQQTIAGMDEITRGARQIAQDYALKTKQQNRWWPIDVCPVGREINVIFAYRATPQGERPAQHIGFDMFKADWSFVQRQSVDEKDKDFLKRNGFSHFMFMFSTPTEPRT